MFNLLLPHSRDLLFRSIGKVIISGGRGSREKPFPIVKDTFVKNFSKLVAKSWREYRVFTRELRLGPELLSRLADLM